jgi:MinD-like ATPase involved in chromosome partitioning or flagellar assembly
LLVDANMSGGHIALHLSISPERHNLMHLASEYQTAGNRLTGDMLKRRAVAADAYLDSRTRVTESRLNVLLGITNIRQASSPELAGRQGEQFITDLLRLARELYDFVVVDLGSSINAGVHIGALRAADTVLFISSDDRSSLYFNRNVFETLVEQSSLRTDKFKLVINGYQPEAGLTLDEIARYMKTPVFATVPHDPTGAVKLAINNGKSYALTHLDIRRNPLEVEATLRGMFAIAEGVYPPLSAILAARDQNLNGHRPSWWQRVLGRHAANGAKR